ncbi:hypothetical protein [Ectopseudomonas hydrolytica]|uniref:hypothetical protein n=1 Tax=Ectopseudomonas hydrolytica TaxID=2493633 RepID=UPI0020B71FB8|nr:hypothetical protein [Pseudomonas hydrolytica]UTH34287.1 hypothetical protein NLY38_25820 [Pseudomonas hydrolytica]UZZ13608.1 hypothetical protein NDO41_27045 [Pseudomonas mendocina]
MNLGQLHQYLGELIAAGADPKLPIILPGQYEDQPQELIEALLVAGPYHADPAPKMVAYAERSGAALLMVGQGFDVDSVRDSHNPTWPPVEAPEPEPFSE